MTRSGTAAAALLLLALGAAPAGVINSVDAFNDHAPCSPPQVGCHTATERLKLVHVHLSSTWCSRFDVGGDTSGNMKGGSCGTQ
jgi:hypothetical protein